MLLMRSMSSSPLLPELAYHVFRREVEVNLGGGESIMTQEPLQGRQRDALLDRRDGERVA